MTQAPAKHALRSRMQPPSHVRLPRPPLQLRATVDTTRPATPAPNALVSLNQLPSHVLMALIRPQLRATVDTTRTATSAPNALLSLMQPAAPRTLARPARTPAFQRATPVRKRLLAQQVQQTRALLLVAPGPGTIMAYAQHSKHVATNCLSIAVHLLLVSLRGLLPLTVQPLKTTVFAPIVLRAPGLPVMGPVLPTLMSLPAREARPMELRARSQELPQRMLRAKHAMLALRRLQVLQTVLRRQRRRHQRRQGRLLNLSP